MGAHKHATIILPRYANMGIKYAYLDPTNTFVVLKTISNAFCAHWVWCAQCMHTVGAVEHATIVLPRYANMGIIYAYIDPTNTLVVLKTVSYVFCANWV